jgi:pimeloyl-ACP methyl ester carboxylesterase
MAKPSDKVFLDVSTQAYKTNPASSVDGFRLLRATTTINAYINDAQKVIIIGVRGTEVKDPGDLKADASLPFNQLKSMSRYTRDAEFVRSVLAQYPGHQVFLTGHSLGGAIDNQLKRDFPQLRDAVEFNPAFQSKDLVYQQPGIKRFYVSTDPLYKLGGRFFQGNIVVPPGSTTGIGLIDALQGHKLAQFSTPISQGPRQVSRGGFGISLLGVGR